MSGVQNNTYDLGTCVCIKHQKQTALMYKYGSRGTFYPPEHKYTRGIAACLSHLIMARANFPRSSIFTSVSPVCTNIRGQLSRNKNQHEKNQHESILRAISAPVLWFICSLRLVRLGVSKLMSFVFYNSKNTFPFL